MAVRVFNPPDRERWNRYVEESVGSSLYHHAGWRNVIEKTFGHRTCYLLSEDSHGGVNGILPLVHIRSFLFGNYIVSLPYFNYGGICADRPEVHRGLLDGAIRVARAESTGHIELRDTRVLDDGLPVKTSKVSMRLVLPASADDLWRSFPSKLRSQIKRPSVGGMEARIGGEEELESFYRVFSINMRDLGTPVYPRRFFRNIVAEFPGSTWICAVYRGVEPVAAGMLAGFKDRLEIPWASSLRRYSAFSPNMLLYWTALKFGCERGFRVFDFGRSTAGEGTYKFKEQWGARPVPLYWYYWLRNGGPMPELSPGNPKYTAAIRIWQHLPVGLTRLLGPAIVKNLP